MWRFRASVGVLFLAVCAAAAADWSVDGTKSGAGGQGKAPGAEVTNAITRGPTLAPARVGADAGQDGVDVDLPVAWSQRFRLDIDPAVVPPGANVPTDPDDFDDIEVDIHATDTSLDDAPDSTDWTTCDGEIIVTGLRPHVAYVLTVRAQIGGVWTTRAHVTGWTGSVDPRSGPVAEPAGGPHDVATSADAYSGLDGRFTLTGTEEGAWTLRTTAPGLSNEGAEHVVRAGSEDVTIVVAPAAR